ncbi:MAG: nuclear transport factor 2 family protein [Anaerolineae bacterium]|nr:nuclear transport factor 2 family protein [Anaerolineae bacterium]MCB9130814.1 nuclear transport factor 2 family protein [Anaerolineales bacterium]MCB0232868.1 nuclear transport factor 2 family protein [Anaerolineae bacterium]MCB0246766.1 nuclear transport factor 2 family protein [Anaerolineae bacterium]MCO5246986.1 nuclear transport factor 2 family protein [Anaerolineae bacterium]
MDQRYQDFVAAWEDVVARDDLRGMAMMFTEDAVFRSPAVYKPYQGRKTIAGILSMVVQVFGPLTYTNWWANDAGGVVMQFATTVASPDGDKRLEIEGVDIFQLDDAGKITELRVMIRPLRGLQAVAAGMEALIAQMASSQ